MNRMIKRVAAAILMFSVISTTAQNKIYDVITLNDDMGVIKGFIREQILGDNPAMSIMPAEALLTINVADIEGGEPTTTIIDDVMYDVLILKDGGEQVVGHIISESLGKWYKISTTQLAERTFAYSEISKVGKELIDADGSIYDTYGVIESITLDNGLQVSGIVVEQELGTSVTVRDIKDNMDKIIDVSSITKIDKAPYRSDVDLFDQCAYLDIVQTQVDSVSFRGVIVSQILGESVTLALVDSLEYSEQISYAQISSIEKELNDFSHKRVEIVVEEDEPAEPADTDEAVVESVEPVNIGFYTFADNRDEFLESYAYKLSNDTKFIVLDGAPMMLSNVLEVGESYSFVLNVDCDVDVILSTFKILELSTNEDRQTKYIEMESKKKKKKDDDVEDRVGVDISCEKQGDGSILVNITPEEVGEYAISYQDSPNIAVFKAE